jgi:hypothetical protein
MSTDQLQLTLIPEEGREAQALPADVREASAAIVARMLLGLVRGEGKGGTAKEGRDESR